MCFAILDSELSMEHYISTVVRACFFHLRRLKSIHRILGADVTSGLVSAFVTTRMDYCNSILAALPQSSIDPLQRVRNAAARLITGTGTREHITPVLQSLHWLPVKFRITFKLCVLMHLVHIGRALAYLSDMHGNGNCWSVQPRKTQIFEHFQIWTSIIEAQVRREKLLLCRTESLEWSSFCSPRTYWYVYFQRQLKTHLFTLAYILTVVHNFVEAPLVTLDVNGVWNNDNVM